MKLARVDHYRCDQPAGKWGLHSYVWIPEEMTEADFGTLCDTARTKYLDNERAWKEASPVASPGYGPSIEAYPDTMTVAEIKAQHADKNQIYKTYEQKRADARKSFATLLVELGNGTIKYFWNEAPSIKYRLDWGHNHGMTIDMGDTKIDDFPSTEEDDEDYL